MTYEYNETEALHLTIERLNTLFFPGDWARLKYHMHLAHHRPQKTNTIQHGITSDVAILFI